MASRFVGYELYNKNTEKANTYFSSVLYGDLLFVGIIFIPASILLWHIQHFINVPDDLVHDVRILFYIVFLNMCISVVGAVFHAVFVITKKLYLDSIRNVVTNILRVIILIALYWLLPTSIIYIGIAALVTGVVAIGCNIFYTRKYLPEIKLKASYVKLSAVKEITASGVWNSFNQLSIVLLHGLDLLICNTMVSAQAMGLLSVAMTLPNAVSSCISTFSYLFTPQFLEHFSRKEFGALKNDINNSIKFMTVISCLPISFLIGFGEPFYQLWTPNTDVQAVFLISVLVILPNFTGAAINSVNNLYSVANQVKWPAIVLAITGVLNVAFIFVLLKCTSLGVYAIVIVSAVIGMVRNIVFNAPYAARCINEKYSIFWPEMFKSFVVLSVCCVICYSVCHLFSITSWAELILIGGSTVALLAILVSYMILNKSQRNYLIQKIKSR
jgi:O-antigen/teichoic acid export membrane protein